MNQTTNSPGPMVVSFIHKRPIKSFRRLPDENAARFIKEFQTLGATWNNRAKVDNFSQYLKEFKDGADDRLELIENELKAVSILDNDGVHSNRWLDLS